MALETVRVYAVNELDDPLVGVLVRAYDGTGTLVGQNTTALVGVEAYCELYLDGGNPPVEYTVRLSKTGVAFDGALGADNRTPQTVAIYSPPALAPVTGTNNFQVQGQTFSRPAALDPRLCRCSGVFRDASGRPLEGLSLAIHPTCFNDGQADLTPLIVDDDAVMLGSAILLKTDEDGYVVCDLYRGADVGIMVAGFEHSWRRVRVPDAASVNVVHLLFPVVQSVTYDPDPVSVAAGAAVDVTATVLATDGQVLDLADGDLLFSSDDEGVATVSVVDGRLRVTGVAAGSAEVVAVRADETIVVVPTPVYASVVVTVTP